MEGTVETVLMWFQLTGLFCFFFQSCLEFSLRIQEFIELIRQNKRMDAVRYEPQHTHILFYLKSLTLTATFSWIFTIIEVPKTYLCVFQTCTEALQPGRRWTAGWGSAGDGHAGLPIRYTHLPIQGKTSVALMCKYIKCSLTHFTRTTTQCHDIWVSTVL